jgi:hypothetical protein
VCLLGGILLHLLRSPFGTKCAFGHVRYGAALGGSAEVTRGLLWIGLGEPAYLSTQRLNSKTIGPACGSKLHGAFYERRLVSPSHIEATRDAPAPMFQIGEVGRICNGPKIVGTGPKQWPLMRWNRPDGCSRPDSVAISGNLIWIRRFVVQIV